MPLTILQGPTIEAGHEESAVMALGMDFIVGLITPEEWTPAVVSVIVSPQGDNYYDLFDNVGREITFNVTPNTFLSLDPDTLLGAAFLKLRSGTRASPVVQEAVRRFLLVGSL